MKQPKNINSYLKIVAVEGAQSADILLYNFIGPVVDYWTGETLPESITDTSFVQHLAELEKKYTRINIRLNSPGGSVKHGDAIVSAMLRSKADIHTWVDGIAASMAADIWLAGKKRHMSANSKLMIHSPSTVTWGTARDLRAEADVLDKFADASIAMMALITGKPEEECKAKYYDYADHWLTAKDALEEGLIDEIEKYHLAPAVPAEPEKMTSHEMLAFFQKHADQPEDAGGLLDFFKNIFQKAMPQTLSIPEGNQPPQLSPTDIQKMNLDDFTKSIESGALDLEAVKSHLAALTNSAAAAPAADQQPDGKGPDSDDDDGDVQKLRAELDALKASNDALAARVAELGAQPGAQPSQVAKSADDYTGDGSAFNLDAYNRLLAESPTWQPFFTAVE